jgi:hypothetical protein
VYSTVQPQFVAYKPLAADPHLLGPADAHAACCSVAAVLSSCTLHPAGIIGLVLRLGSGGLMLWVVLTWWEERREQLLHPSMKEQEPRLSLVCSVTRAVL